MEPRYILETAIYVTDLIKAEKFYTEVLGLKVNSKKEGRHIFFNCGRGMLLVFNPEETIKSSGKVPAHGSKGQGHVAFAIDSTDFDKWKSHLKEHNVEMESEVDWDQGGPSIYFRDPSGNSIELTTPSIWGIH